MNPSSNNNSNSNININRLNNDNNDSNSNQNHNHNRSNGNSNNTYHYNNSATATTTITDTNRSTNADHNEVRPILKLRHHRQPNKVKWTDETIDNEHMNKKKTKICCIFHPADGESCSSSESESDNSDDEPQGGDINNIGPNAYEKQPHYKTS